MKNSAELFLKKVANDLNAAIYLYEGFESGKVEIDIETIMFHLQQCAEKLLKALLTLEKKEFPKTDDLNYLLNLAKNIDLPKNIELVEDLNEFAVEGRYAIICDEIENIEVYIKILNDLLEFTKRRINGTII